MLSEIFILTVLGINLLCMIFAMRNNIVHEYRIRMINEIYKDTDSFSFPFKVKEFHSVSYHEMVLKFWKPMNSFYPNLGKEEK